MSRTRERLDEVMIVWTLWLVLLAAVFVAYMRLDPSELYHVSGDGLSGGLSRAVVLMNFPLAIVGVALALISLDALSSRWWWIGGPALAMCGVAAWPGVVDNADLDARAINAVPALGVLLALGLTVAAAQSSGVCIRTRLQHDTIRVAVIGALIVLSVPWIVADLGFFLPDFVFITERSITGSDGRVNAAVHLGHHHGLDGAVLTITALVLSRIRLRSRYSLLTTGYVSLMLAYGAVNFVQDLWHEQIQKRGWVDWKIPSALEPALSPIWVMILALAAVTMMVLRREESLGAAGPIDPAATRFRGRAHSA